MPFGNNPSYIQDFDFSSVLIFLKFSISQELYPQSLVNPQKRKTSKEIEQEELRSKTNKNKLYLTQTMNSKYKLQYASKLFWK